MAGYCALVVEHTASQAIQYFVSTYISAEANLYALLVITILAVPLFTVADIHYGSGTSRNICGRKRLERQERDLVDNGCTQCELTAVSSNKKKGMCGCMEYYFHQACHQCIATFARQGSCYYDVYHSHAFGLSSNLRCAVYVCIWSCTPHVH